MTGFCVDFSITMKAKHVMPNAEIRMTNAEGGQNHNREYPPDDEAPTVAPLFVIRSLTLIRHSSFVHRHYTFAG
jgi:hypothetical protein